MQSRYAARYLGSSALLASMPFTRGSGVSVITEPDGSVFSPGPPLPGVGMRAPAFGVLPTPGSPGPGTIPGDAALSRGGADELRCPTSVLREPGCGGAPGPVREAACSLQPAMSLRSGSRWASAGAATAVTSAAAIETARTIPTVMVSPPRGSRACKGVAFDVGGIDLAASQRLHMFPGGRR